MAVKDLSERDICTKFITPAIVKAGWDVQSQIREEVSFTKGRIIVRGKLVTRGKAKRADYILYYKPNIPLALIEAKDGSNAVGAGMLDKPDPEIDRIEGNTLNGVEIDQAVVSVGKTNTRTASSLFPGRRADLLP